jgi:hypothetical protein
VTIPDRRRPCGQPRISRPSLLAHRVRNRLFTPALRQSLRLRSLGWHRRESKSVAYPAVATRFEVRDPMTINSPRAERGAT